jgi:hypothetical protein
MASAEYRLQKLLDQRQKKRNEFFDGYPGTLEQLMRAVGYDNALSDQIEACKRELKGEDNED